MRFTSLVAATLLTACGRPPSPSLATVRAQLERGSALLVDVREPWEWNAGHLAAARPIPLSEISRDASAAAGRLPRGRPIYVYCAAGPRARRAARVLSRLGLDAHPLAEGFVELARAGFPTERLRFAQ